MPTLPTTNTEPHVARRSPAKMRRRAKRWARVAGPRSTPMGYHLTTKANGDVPGVNLTRVYHRRPAPTRP